LQGRLYKPQIVKRLYLRKLLLKPVALPGRYGLVRDLIFIAVLAFSLTRLALALRVGGEADWTIETVANVALLGLLYDLTTALLLALPLGLLLTVLPERWTRFRTTWILTGLAIASGLFALLFNAVAEWLFWDEFSSRFNFIAVDYLIYTNEVIGNIRQSYPVGWILGGLGSLALLGTLAARQRVLQRLTVAAPLKTRLTGFAIHALLALSLLAAVSGDAGENLRNVYARELAGNGPFEFVRAFKNNEIHRP